ncbi:CIC11C00000000390 [Sungouiella intermedia]|uniref:CIC11C00000000390 n=1 Tax=Sungouiella intermedia TaxID=45354 RepID=A0A1L0DH10_9ASCO|nr:CIC11C00000000390 [[Candida] intermedia]
MNSATIAVHWHDDSQPVYSVSLQPVHYARSQRLATAGGDNNVRVWSIKYESLANLEETSVEYLSTLRKHTQAVNAVKFDPTGQILATAGDDGMLILWTRADHIVLEFGHHDDDVKESWVVKLLNNTQLEIYDICWSPDSKYIATGSMDNITKIYSVEGQKLCELADHSHYVQGVTWDPLNEYLATQGADRTLHIYSLKENVGEFPFQLVPTLFFKVLRAELPSSKLLTPGYTSSGLTTEAVLSSTEGSPRSPPTLVKTMSPPSQKHVHQVFTSPKRKTLPSESLAAVIPSTGKVLKRLKRSSLLYHSETLQSFFRRLAFSPDGSLLLTPLGIYKNDDNTDDKDTPDSTFLNTVYIYTRSGLNKPPVCHLPGLPKPAVAISFNPITYEVLPSLETMAFKLPYKMVFAVATQDSVFIYDTQSLRPIGSLSNLHYLTITDLSWDNDGQHIIVSSAEGFCSVIGFEEGIFGTPYDNIGTATEDEKKIPEKEARVNNMMDTESTSDNRRLGQMEQKLEQKLAKELSQEVELLNRAAPNSHVEISGPIMVSDKDTLEEDPEYQKQSQVLEPVASTSSNTLVTPSLLSQFMAEPVTASPQTAQTDFLNEREQEKSKVAKKRRITPTLVNTE